MEDGTAKGVPGAALARLTAALEDNGRAVHGTSAQCPGPGHANGDRHPSLSIGQGRDGAVLECHRKPPCPTDVILEVLGLSWPDLFDEPRTRRSDDT